jgi:uncharacterized protein with PQ loop repeat
MKYLFGWIATSLSLSYKLPQIYKLVKTKDTTGLSNYSLLLQACSYGFYFVHGFLIDDPPIMALGSVSLIQSVIILYLYYYYKNP